MSHDAYLYLPGPTAESVHTVLISSKEKVRTQYQNLGGSLGECCLTCNNCADGCNDQVCTCMTTSALHIVLVHDIVLNPELIVPSVHEKQIFKLLSCKKALDSGRLYYGWLCSGDAACQDHEGQDSWPLHRLNKNMQLSDECPRVPNPVPDGLPDQFCKMRVNLWNKSSTSDRLQGYDTVALAIKLFVIHSKEHETKKESSPPGYILPQYAWVAYIILQYCKRNGVGGGNLRNNINATNTKIHEVIGIRDHVETLAGLCCTGISLGDDKGVCSIHEVIKYLFCLAGHIHSNDQLDSTCEFCRMMKKATERYPIFAKSLEEFYIRYHVDVNSALRLCKLCIGGDWLAKLFVATLDPNTNNKKFVKWLWVMWLVIYHQRRIESVKDDDLLLFANWVSDGSAEYLPKTQLCPETVNTFTGLWSIFIKTSTLFL